MNPARSIEKLTVAALIGGGELYKYKLERESIKFSYHSSKEQYLRQLISINNLYSYVKLNVKNRECLISTNKYNKHIILSWKENNESFVNSNITQDILYLFIILFGKRQIEGILINCQESMVANRSIGYFTQMLLGVLAIPNTKNLKILDVPNLVLSAIKKEIGLTECVEIANFLNENEKKQLTKAINGIERQLRSYEMA
ncbi:hypothetical protein K7887_22585 (plasmid) [Sutcliffiella horikoshii]|uniref:hypothetical protein n=1 Tax=Sutcliffiella horikoshii TaxID=79883 RepID=UPI001CBB5904|nr:hypothetical protein [Sutcliffiella horikoshii]UAL49756.1 hypothetical protein K7887_22585 [Sutcliffiella horikoshii]